MAYVLLYALFVGTVILLADSACIWWLFWVLFWFRGGWVSEIGLSTLDLHPCYISFTPPVLPQVSKCVLINAYVCVLMSI